jgi:predicted transcriptional regulator
MIPMTINISDEMNEKLGRLAHDTRRSAAYLATEALSTYVDHELDILNGIQRGLDDVKAGRVVPHSQAKAEIYGVIEAAKLK